MNAKEIGEIRRRQKRERSNMRAFYGCYVNENKEIISEFKRPVATMPTNESDKYFLLLHRVLGGAQGDHLGKNLLDITFATAQVADSPEHKLLMDLRGEGIENEALRQALFRKAIESLTLEGNFLILLGAETYDVPFKNAKGDSDSDASDKSFSYILCAICPVKQTKAVLHYQDKSKDFQDGNIVEAVKAPVLGFMFPAFDDRATNIYNALYFSRSAKDNQEAFVKTIFNTPIAKPAEEQKAEFSEVIAGALDAECDISLVQAVQTRVSQQLQLHKEAGITETLTFTKRNLQDILQECGVSEEGRDQFGDVFEKTFGEDAQLYPRNIVDTKKCEIRTPDVYIRVPADRSDLIQTRVIGGVKYIMVRAEEGANVNGVDIHIGD